MYAKSPSVDFRHNPGTQLDSQEDNTVNSLDAIARFIEQEKHKNSFDWMTATLNA